MCLQSKLAGHRRRLHFKGEKKIIPDGNGWQSVWPFLYFDVLATCVGWLSKIRKYC